MVAAGGFGSLLLGIVLFIEPAVGVYALLFGSLLSAAFRLRYQRI